MAARRREFLKAAGLAGLTSLVDLKTFADTPHLPMTPADDSQKKLLGPYGDWATSLNAGKLPSLSFRNSDAKDLNAWKKSTRQRLADRIAAPTIGATPSTKVIKTHHYDGLIIEELTWQLPWGPATEGVLLKPEKSTGKLPAVLAFHDHGGNKFFGTKKISRTSDTQHPLMVEHQKTYYSGYSWANELAKKGYVVLVPDTFPFASRKILPGDVPERQRNQTVNPSSDNAAEIEAYNRWASDYESIIAKSLFSAGTTWPGVWLAEDRAALDILSARPEVDADRIGCGGLSGGGMRTVFLAGMDDRIKCAVPVGFMTTWNDFASYTAYTHTWMIYVPLLPNEIDFPEILSLRTPLASLVLNNTEDQLFTLSEMKKADEILSQVYAKAGSSNNYKCSFHAGLHKFDATMQKEAFAWLDQWLKK